MSSGTEVFGPNVFDPYFQGSGSYRSWNGANGQYEFVSGRRRKKWNSYYYVKCLRRRPRSFIVNGIVGNGPNDPNPYTTAFSIPVGTGGNTEWFTDPNYYLRLLSKLNTSVKGHDFNMAVNVAELGKTSNMVVTSLGKIGRSMLALKRGDFATAARQLGVRPRGTRLKSSDISGRWLELQYGWGPAVRDSYEAAKAYESITKGARVKRFTSRLHEDIDIEFSTYPFWTLTGKSRVSRQLTAELQEDMSAARSLGLLNPSSVAWELIPYSFVVDWFIPIGSYIDLVFSIPSLIGRFEETDCRSRGFQGRPEPLNFSIPGWFINSGSGIWIFSLDPTPEDAVKFLEYNRTTKSGLTVPTPKFDLTGISHGKRIWNAIALAHQRFR